MASKQELLDAAYQRIGREASLAPFRQHIEDELAEAHRVLVALNDDRQLAQAQGAARILAGLKKKIDQGASTGL